MIIWLNHKNPEVVADQDEQLLAIEVMEATILLLEEEEKAVKEEEVYVIEANPRASRTVPFICKAHKVAYVNIATKVMLGDMKLKDFDIKPLHEGYAIKKPVFSFNKFPNVNKPLGPEMKSTGEEILFVKEILRIPLCLRHLQFVLCFFVIQFITQ